MVTQLKQLSLFSHLRSPIRNLMLHNDCKWSKGAWDLFLIRLYNLLIVLAILRPQLSVVRVVNDPSRNNILVSYHHCCSISCTHTMCGVAISGTSVQPFQPESLSADSFSLLLQLDEIRDPGVSEEVFNELFLKCSKCRKHMTRRAVIFHNCAAASQDAVPMEVIDLTNEM